MKILLAILLTLSFTSCMHWGMMGVGQSHHADQMHMMTNRTALEREVTAGNVKAIGAFPTLELGKDVTLTLKLVDAKTSSPISDGQVHFEVQHLDPVTHNESPHHAMQSVAESRLSGVYTIPFRAAQPGEYRLMFHITAIGNQELEPEIDVETTRVLSSESQEHHGSMMNGTGTTPALIIGAVTMGAMMLLMHVTGSGMF